MYSGLYKGGVYYMIIPRNMHPIEHALYESVHFVYMGKVYFGQINQTEGVGIFKKYKIQSENSLPCFSTWVTSSSIMPAIPH